MTGAVGGQRRPGARDATKECHGVLELGFGDLRTRARAARRTLERPRAEWFSIDLVDEFEGGGRLAARALRFGADGEHRHDLAALIVLGVRNEREREPVARARRPSVWGSVLDRSTSRACLDSRRAPGKPLPWGAVRRRPAERRRRRGRRRFEARVLQRVAHMAEHHEVGDGEFTAAGSGHRSSFRVALVAFLLTLRPPQWHNRWVIGNTNWEHGLMVGTKKLWRIALLQA